MSSSTSPNLIAANSESKAGDAQNNAFPTNAFKRCYIPENVPSTDEFTTYIQRDIRAVTTTRPYQPKKGELLEPPLSLADDDYTYLSFGDDGTTASVTELGQLMQMSRYLGPGRSSVFVADCQDIWEPYMIDGRARQLQEKTQYPAGFGKDILPPTSNWKRSVSFLRDRWPRVVFVDDKIYEIVLQWLVKDGVVIQQTIIRNLTDKPLQFQHIFDFSVLIRELDFIDPSYKFNEEEGGETEDENYNEGPGPNGYGFVKVHKLPRGEDANESYASKSPERWCTEDSPHDVSSNGGDSPAQPEAVGVVMGLFVNGVAKKLDDFKDNRDFEISPNGGEIELTAGYKLVLLSSAKNDWKRLTMSAKEVDMDFILAESRFDNYDELEFDFAARRNLQHILSVCALPVGDHLVWKGSIEDVVEPRSEDRQVALTCGDMSGHRICHSASFFAFKFLTSVARYIRLKFGSRSTNDNPINTDPIKLLRNTIREVCKAHLKWVFMNCEIKDHHFAKNYWVNGKAMPRTSQLAPDTPTDTPFQILKAFEYYQEFKVKEPEEDKKLAEDMAFIVLLQGGPKQSAMSWVRQIDRQNKRDSYAWRHLPTTDIGTFRLDDHVWLWNSLKALSTILDWKKKWKSDAKVRGEKAKEPSPEDLRKKYEPDKVQREITRRFTTENDHSKQRMLAVTRSSRENRFVFHSRDTALFYKLAGSFIDDGARILSDVWKNTLEAQRDQEANQDMEWDNPLRYALAIVMAKSGYSINRLSSEDALTKALEALDRSMLRNGLFPGQIDEATHEESLFVNKYYRDFYFHVGFEVPYVLWECKTGDNLPRTNTGSSSLQTLLLAKPQRQLSVTIAELSNSPPNDGGTGLEGPATTLVPKEPPLMKGKIPFNNFIDSQNIVEISEEWLYDYPSFLDYEPQAESFTRESLQAIGSEVGEVVLKAITAFQQHSEGTKPEDEYKPTGLGSDVTEEQWMRHWRTRVNLVQDVAKKKLHGKTASASTDNESGLVADYGLWAILRGLRKADKAKKRFIWLPNASLDCALICFLAAHEAEKESISFFFDNHAHYFTLFSDEAVRAQNIWRTEFHTRFLQLMDPQTDSLDPDRSSILTPESVSILKDCKLNGRSLVHASTGFKFTGDFMDRFWTCHFIEFLPHKFPDYRLRSPLLEEVEPRAGTWRQRKVLELILFNRIIFEMNRSTKEIIDLINDKLRAETDGLSASKLKSDRYFKISIEWEALGQILEAMDTDFGDIMTNITDWETRDRDRQQEQPRWTKDDERKYRLVINKLLANSRRKLRELRNYQNTVKSLKTSIATTQERIRNELSLRGNENIRYFTYATVFFLPLGFAASVFSMQAAPSHNVLIGMVICAVVGLVVTILALVTIQGILKMLEDAIGRVRDFVMRKTQKIEKEVDEERSMKSRPPSLFPRK